jgi:hypothetical protein
MIEAVQSNVVVSFITAGKTFQQDSLEDTVAE